MNRFLAIPLGLSCLLFAGVFLSESIGKTRTSYAVQVSSPQEQELLPGEADEQEADTSELLTLDQARTLVLDGWPTAGKYAWGSRAAPRVSAFAELQEFLWRPREQTQLTDEPCILTSLVVVSGETVYFPIHIDRKTQAIKIFAEQTWKPYTEWRDGYLPGFLESVKK